MYILSKAFRTYTSGVLWNIFFCMSWQSWNKSWLIVAILCHSPASDMLEFDFHVMILHLMSFYSCVNNPMHIEIYVLFYLRFLFLYWNSAMNCTCICIWFSIVFAEYVFSIVFAEYVFSIEMWIFIFVINHHFFFEYCNLNCMCVSCWHSCFAK